MVPATLNAQINSVTQFNIGSAFVQSTADAVCGINVSSSGTQFIIAANTDLVLSTTQAIITGSGSMQIKLRYQILDTSTTSSF